MSQRVLISSVYSVIYATFAALCREQLPGAHGMGALLQLQACQPIVIRSFVDPFKQWCTQVAAVNVKPCRRSFSLRGYAVSLSLIAPGKDREVNVTRCQRRTQLTVTDVSARTYFLRLLGNLRNFCCALSRTATRRPRYGRITAATGLPANRHPILR